VGVNEIQPCIVVTAAVEHAEDIARFQVEMAMESEGLALNCECVRQGVKAVFADQAKGRYVVALCDGKVVGCLMITREWSDWRSAWYWWIQSVYVLPSYRGRGIYRAMYHYVLAQARSESVSQVRLYVDRENTTAQTVYQKLDMAECHYLLYESQVEE
jgi:GNAT superfamily N-acetyltransferase